ncbi:MAG: paraquat-inducible protein A [Roseobacter sp.]
MTAEQPQPRDDLIVCPQCDAIYQVHKLEKGEKAICSRCDTVLATPRRKAGAQIIAVSVAIVILTAAVAVFPFLTIYAAGAVNSVSIIDAALAFQGGPMIVLAVLTAGFILVIPLARVLLCLYVLLPLVLDRPPAPKAARAFRLAEMLRPWAMAEIFAIGCAVSLVKINQLADVTFGPAFWMFTGLVVLVLVQDNFLCRWSVWNALSKNQKS